MIGFRYPALTAMDPMGQLIQLRGYLNQLVDQLNQQVQSGGNRPAASVARTARTSGADVQNGETAGFNDIKSLIIKSADIVKAYYEQIDKLLKLSGEYTAEASFPEGAAAFVENTGLTVSANSKAIEQFYTDMQVVISKIDGVREEIYTNAYMRSGLLDYDPGISAPIYGLEVGQETEINGEKVFDKYARFTASKLSFYDQNGKEVAYISDNKLFISHAEITGSLTVGGFVDVVKADKSVVTKWVGGEM